MYAVSYGAGRRVDVDADDVRVPADVAERAAEARLLPRRHRAVLLHRAAAAHHRPLLAHRLPRLAPRRARLRQHLRRNHAYLLTVHVLAGP